MACWLGRYAGGKPPAALKCSVTAESGGREESDAKHSFSHSAPALLRRAGAMRTQILSGQAELLFVCSCGIVRSAERPPRALDSREPCFGFAASRKRTLRTQHQTNRSPQLLRRPARTARPTRWAQLRPAGTAAPRDTRFHASTRLARIGPSAQCVPRRAGGRMRSRKGPINRGLRPTPDLSWFGPPASPVVPSAQIPEESES